MKKLFAIFMIMVVALFTGCGAKTDAREYTFDENVSYYKLYEPDPDYTLCEKADDDTARLFEAICEAEKVVMNEVYQMNLQSENIDVFFTDSISKTVYGHTEESRVDGYYSHELNQVFLNSRLKENRELLMGVMAHEAVHFLYAFNNDIDKQFFVYKNDNGELGDALIEGLTQRLALNNLYAMEQQGYCVGAYDAVIKDYYTNTSVADLISMYSVPEIDKYYLSNNFEAARKEFNEKVGSINSDYEPFELLEDALQKTQKFEAEGNVEEGTKYLGDIMTLIAYSVSNSDVETRKQFLQNIDSMVCFTEDFSQSIHEIVGDH
ncbi:MAG: hypothetical protein IKE91_04140 [Clostridia bacterium]|nr:hypothetical protein [Clostridia bacterium]